MTDRHDPRVLALLRQGEQTYQRGQWSEAARLFERAHALVPDHPVAWQRRGAVALRRDQPEAAVDALTRALEHGTGDDALDREAFLLLAQALETLDQPDAAVQALAVAAQRFPEDAPLLLRLGALCVAAGRWEDAAHCFAVAAALRPDLPSTAYNHGIALKELGRPQEAVEAFERAVSADPAYARAFHAMGLAYQAMDAWDAALVALDCAIGADPSAAEFQTERARTLLRLHRPADALTGLDAFVAAHATAAGADVDVHNLRAIALRQLGRTEAARLAYDQALALRPDFFEGLYNRANLNLGARRFATALADFDRALALRPGHEWLPGLRLYTALHLYDWTDFDARVAALREGIAQGRRVAQPLVVQGLIDDPEVQRDAARIWAAASLASPATPPPVRPKPDARLRIAYIAREFREHAVAYLMAEVLALHDRARFEVLAINHGPVRDDAMQRRLRTAVDGFIDVERMPDAQVAALCRELQVDVAVDLTGYTDGARGGIFAARAAPVQVMYIGYLGSAGCAAVYDHVVVDAVIAPPSARADFDERLIRLPVFQANDRQRPRPTPAPSRARLGLPERGLVCCCFNNPAKITPEVFATWAEILRQLPDAVLWVLGEDPLAEEHLRTHARGLGVDPARLVFAGRTDRERYLARLGAADLFLDTWPYNAGATASDALWMGLPVLTRLGQAFPGRVAASLLTAAGLPELIAPTRQAYIDTAVRLGRHAPALAALRRRLDDPLALPLFDTPRFTRHLEQAFAEAVRACAAGQAPADIVVTD